MGTWPLVLPYCFAVAFAFCICSNREICAQVTSAQPNSDHTVERQIGERICKDQKFTPAKFNELLRLRFRAFDDNTGSTAVRALERTTGSLKYRVAKVTAREILLAAAPRSQANNTAIELQRTKLQADRDSLARSIEISAGMEYFRTAVELEFALLCFLADANDALVKAKAAKSPEHGSTPKKNAQAKREPLASLDEQIATAHSNRQRFDELAEQIRLLNRQLESGILDGEPPADSRFAHAVRRRTRLTSAQFDLALLRFAFLHHQTAAREARRVELTGREVFLYVVKIDANRKAIRDETVSPDDGSLARAQSEIESDAAELTRALTQAERTFVEGQSVLMESHALVLLAYGDNKSPARASTSKLTPISKPLYGANDDYLVLKALSWTFRVPFTSKAYRLLRDRLQTELNRVSRG